MPLVDILVEVAFASVVLFGVLVVPVWGGAAFVKHRMAETNRQNKWTAERRLSHERR
jgi:hypothetical protein